MPTVLLYRLDLDQRHHAGSTGGVSRPRPEVVSECERFASRSSGNRPPSSPLRRAVRFPRRADVSAPCGRGVLPQRATAAAPRGNLFRLDPWPPPHRSGHARIYQRPKQATRVCLLRLVVHVSFSTPLKVKWISVSFVRTPDGALSELAFRARITAIIRKLTMSTEPIFVSQAVSATIVTLRYKRIM